MQTPSLSHRPNRDPTIDRISARERVDGLVMQPLLAEMSARHLALWRAS